ncbi:hypothetical protein H310_10224 [Aphanomyces invadans]|uniref:Uncharacterized protein n=1 Tax=Aphanomyces invadans TaxID=157072 RepID=A0A024TSA1_9STRA|nr:hypothetical protein H310_10224 [Aphanomyces invadans]ETV96496.1 hypothetical protein H310_10224 [Aphanomyces invadans]|eukprot:XP_008874759.1 hypothetical protein H310_10224 [Aphanomyces invadans]
MGACLSIDDELHPTSSTASVPPWMTAAIESWRYQPRQKSTMLFRRNKESVPSALAVLLNVDLLRQVGAFQPGISRMIRYLLCRWQRQTGPYAKAHFIVHALPTDHAVDRLFILTQLHQTHAHVLSRTLMDLLAKAGYLECIEYMHKHFRHGCTRNAMDLSAACGHLNIVQFLHIHRTEGCSTGAMDLAAAGGHLDVVQFLHDHRTEGCTQDALHLAAANGHVDVVAFLQTHYFAPSTPNRLHTSCGVDEPLPTGPLSSPAVHVSSPLTAPSSNGYRHEWLALSSYNLRRRRLVLPVVDGPVDGPDDADDQARDDASAVPMALNAMEWAVLHGQIEVVAYLHRLHVDTAAGTSTTSAHVLDLAAQRGHGATTVAYIHEHNLVASS